MPGTGEPARPLRVLFMGTPELAVPSLEALSASFEVVAVATRPDRRVGRGRRPELSPVKARAVEAGLPVLQPRTLRDREVVAELASLAPDVIAVVAYGLLLPHEVLDLPPLGCVNLHASLLPRHRGASPIQAAILAGDGETGVTTMLMDEGLDTGPTLLREKVAIAPDDTAGTLGARLAETGGGLLVRTLEGLSAGAVVPVPQDPAAATTTGLIRKQDGRIDWRLPATDLERLVRAMQPWPTAFTFHAGTRLQIWRARVAATSTDAEPGTVLAAADAFGVACGGGSVLHAIELQRAGGRRLPAADLLRGFALPPGTRLESEESRRTGE